MSDPSTRSTSSPDPDRRTVTLDPESLTDCQRLADALYSETSVDTDPAAIRDALRILAPGSRS